MIHSATLVPVLAAIGAKDVLLAVFALVLLGLVAAFLCLRGRIRASVAEQTRADFSEELLSRFRRGMESRIGGGGATTDPQDGMDRILAYANIAEALSGGYECIYYIDMRTGHFDQYRAHGLIENLRARVASDSHLHVWALFDGTIMNAEAEADGRLRVGYTGGTGAHRADRMVCDYLRMRKILGLNHPVTVVTDDKDFAKEAAALGAAVKGTDTLDAQTQAN